MNRWGASLKCRNDLTVGIDSDAATPTPSNALSLVEEASYPSSRVTAPWRCVRKSHGVSRLASALFCLIILLCFCSLRVNAAEIPNDTEEQVTEALPSTESVLLFDRSPPPEPFMQQFLKRAERSTSTSSSASSSSSSTASSDALPIPFDTALGNNFTTSSCPAFFKSFLSNDTFNECVPLSLLLQVSRPNSTHKGYNHETHTCFPKQTSTSFFSIQRSPVRLAQTLGASCSVNFDSCNTLMASLARQIQSPNNCAADLQNQNPTVMQAYTGFIAYQSLYHAGCLLNSNTGSYCKSMNLSYRLEHVLMGYPRLLGCSYECFFTYRQLRLLSAARHFIA